MAHLPLQKQPGRADDDPCVETADYNFQVGKPHKAYFKVLHSESLYFQACVKEHLAQKVGCR